MTMRRMLLGVVAGTMCSAVMAKPPSAISEGREVDPVARDFQLGEPPAAPENAVPSRAAEKPGDLFGGSLLAAIFDAITNGMSIPLGIVPPVESR
jgi:hypothetical protein